MRAIVLAAGVGWRLKPHTEDTPKCLLEFGGKTLLRRYLEACVALGGSVTGEHGIGLIRKEYLGLSLDAAQIAAMRRIKEALDPKGIMNPGKVFL